MGLCSESAATELLIIAVFALIIFGPDKLPEIARTVGKAMNEFKRAQEDMERMIKAEMYGHDPTRPAAERRRAAATRRRRRADREAAVDRRRRCTDDDDEEEDEE